MKLKYYADRVMMLSAYSHAITNPDPDDKDAADLILEAERKYPDETMECKCPAHAPVSRAFWMAQDSMVRALHSANGKPDNQIDDNIFDHTHVCAMGDMVVESIVDDEENQEVH